MTSLDASFASVETPYLTVKYPAPPRGGPGFPPSPTTPGMGLAAAGLDCEEVRMVQLKIRVPDVVFDAIEASALALGTAGRTVIQRAL